MGCMQAGDGRNGAPLTEVERNGGTSHPSQERGDRVREKECVCSDLRFWSVGFARMALVLGPSSFGGKGPQGRLSGRNRGLQFPEATRITCLMGRLTAELRSLHPPLPRCGPLVLG